MLVRVQIAVIKRWTAPLSNFVDEPRIPQSPKRPVDCAEADPGKRAPDLLVHLPGVNVPAGLPDSFQNGLPLMSYVEWVLGVHGRVLPSVTGHAYSNYYCLFR